MSRELPVFLTAEWRHLVMLNYPIDPAILQDRIPAGTELDFWNGQTFVSLVGFRFLNTKLRGFPIPCHRNFSEVNLRFYVRRWSGEEWRRGVVFIKEIVALPAVTLVARRVYNENYVTLAMRHCIELATTDGKESSVAYGWKWQGQWTELAAHVIGQPQPLTSGSDEEFITEHYWGYTTQRDGTTMEYEVAHPRWNVWRATTSRLNCDVASFYGTEFVDALSRPPASALIADGSEVMIRKGSRLPIR